jgi:hypothetical protein
MHDKVWLRYTSRAAPTTAERIISMESATGRLLGLLSVALLGSWFRHCQVTDSDERVSAHPYALFCESWVQHSHTLHSAQAAALSLQPVLLCNAVSLFKEAVK